MLAYELFVIASLESIPCETINVVLTQLFGSSLPQKALLGIVGIQFFTFILFVETKIVL